MMTQMTVQIQVGYHFYLSPNKVRAEVKVNIVITRNVTTQIGYNTEKQ